MNNLKMIKIFLINKIEDLEHKNSLLTENIDLDFIEILIREKFLFGKEGETTYIIKDNGNQKIDQDILKKLINRLILLKRNLSGLDQSY